MLKVGSVYEGKRKMRAYTAYGPLKSWGLELLIFGRISLAKNTANYLPDIELGNADNTWVMAVPDEDVLRVGD